MSVFDHGVLRNDIVGAAVSLSDNAIAPDLVAEALRQGIGRLTADGAFVVETGAFTGRSPKDKFIVRDELTENSVWWDNSGALSPEHFSLLLGDVKDQQIITARSDARASFRVLREFKVHRLARKTKHNAIITGMIFETGQLWHTQAVSIKRDHGSEFVCWSCDTHLCRNGVSAQ